MAEATDESAPYRNHMSIIAPEVEAKLKMKLHGRDESRGSLPTAAL